MRTTRENAWKGRQEARGAPGRGWMMAPLPEREVVHAGLGELGAPQTPAPSILPCPRCHAGSPL